MLKNLVLKDNELYLLYVILFLEIERYENKKIGRDYIMRNLTLMYNDTPKGPYG